MIRSRCSFACATFVCVLFLGISGWQLRLTESVKAQGTPAPVPVWSPTGGPQDAQVSALFFAQGQLFAAANDSVWASSDAGRTWQKRSTGLPEFGLPASFAALENTLFVGTRLGVYRSTDGGQRWQAANVGFPGNPLNCLLTTEADRLYALTYGYGLFVSTDKGNSWTPLNQGLPGSAYAYSVRNGVIWVATARGVYRSTDGGQSWARVHQGIPGAAVVNTMAIVGERVFAAATELSVTGLAQPRGVFVWDEPMSRWLAFNDGLNSLNINQLFAHGTDLYVATDRGVSRTEAARAMWVSVSNGLRGNTMVMAANGTTLIAGSGGDLFTSANRGDSWAALNARFGTATFFTAFAYNNAGAYVATPSGVFLRPNQVPAVWRRVSEGLTDAFVVDLATQGQTLWAASRSGVVHFSGNNGDSWSNLSTGLSIGTAGQSLTAIAANDRMVFVGTQASGVFSLIRRDGRDTWQAANEGLGASRRIHDLLATNAAIYVATDKGIYRSTNDGGLWTSLNVALPTDGGTGKMLEPKSLALDGTTLYAVLGVPLPDPPFIGFGSNTPNVPLRYDLNTSQWSQVQLSPNVPADFAQIVATQQGLLALGPGSNQFVSVGQPIQIQQSPVWFSGDKGATWNPADAGLRRGGFFGFIFQPTIFSSQANLLGATPTQGLVATLNDQGVYARDLISMACRFDVNTRTNTLPPMASTIAVTVTASSNTCAWRADSQSDWITVVGGSGATGSGEVRLSFAANQTTDFRNGSVVIAGTTLQFQQAGCAVTAAPETQRLEANGGTATVRITAMGNCPWEIRTNASWLTATMLKGAGDATVNFTVAPNASSQSRSTQLIINDKIVNLTQAGAQSTCAAQTITPGQWTRGTLSANDCLFGGLPADYHSFTARAGQEWTATTFNANNPNLGLVYPQAPSIHLITPDGSVKLLQAELFDPSQLPANSKFFKFTTEQAGTYTLVVFGASSDYLIRLMAADCVIVSDRYVINVPVAGGNDQILARTEAGCAWQAISSVPWIRLTGNTNGTGNGVVGFSVAENPGIARNGFILINNKHFSIRQPANANAARTLTGLNPSFAEIGATGLLLNVTGNGFTNESRVLLGELPLATTFVSATQLRAALPASELLRAGEVQVSVETPTPSLWRTPALPFVVRPAQQLWASANGPGGGFISTLHQQGTRLWAGVNNGRVFASNNGGLTWQAMPSLEGGTSKFVTAGNFLYAEVGSTIFRLNLNSPAGWDRLPFAEGPVFLHSLHHLTAKGSSVFAIFGNKLYRLDAEATFWKLVNDKFAENIEISGMEAAGNGSTDPLYLLASEYVNTGGVINAQINTFLLASTDEGKTWRRIMLTLPPLTDRVSTTNINRLYIINRRPYFASTDGIFRLDDREQVVRVGNASDGTGNAPANAVALVWDSDTLYAAVREFVYYVGPSFEVPPPQVFRLEGDRWVAADTGLNTRYVQSLVATANGLFVGTAKGIWHSGNRGDLWTERNQGLNATSVFLMTTSGNALYAASDAGLHRTVNNGQTWTRADHGLPTDALFGFASSGNSTLIGRFGTWINALAANGNTLYAALPSGIYRSTDQGQSWRNTGLVEYTTSSFAFAGAQVLAGSYKGLFSPLATTQPGVGGLGLYPPVDFGVYRSPNGTGSWQFNSNSDFGDSVVAMTTLNNKVFAATSQSGIRVSDDNGLTWRSSSTGLDAARLYSLVTVNNALLAAAHSGVFRSTDQGQTWRATNAPSSTFTALVAQGATVFGLSFGEVYRSDNFGETWVQLPTAYVDQITGGTSNGLLCLQPLGDRLFVGTPGDGVLVANLAPTRAAAVNAASYAGGELAPGSIATIFGSNLATGTQIAPGDNLPEEMLGTRVIIRSSRGTETAAKLFFVSPGQINFLVPFLSPDAIPTQIFVTTASGQQSLAEVRITDKAFGLFAANGNGQGVPAAVALRVKADGSQSYEPVFRFDAAQNRFVAIPLDVSAANGTLFLVLYGTGIDQTTKLEQVSATIDGQATRVLYAGPQGGLAGVAQLNLALPAALAGRGEVELRVSVNGKAANVLRVAFR